MRKLRFEKLIHAVIIELKNAPMIDLEGRTMNDEQT